MQTNTSTTDVIFPHQSGYSPALTSVIRFAQRAHSAGKTVVLVTGVFDVLHQEHLRFLRAAKASGEVLLVGVESDIRVRQIKGVGRPINAQLQRQQNLKVLQLADAVFVLPELFNKSEHHLAFVQALRPDVLAVSAHSPHLAEKKAIVRQVGGRVVVVLEHNPQISTTKLLKKIKT